jgi:hypothetical protein
MALDTRNADSIESDRLVPWLAVCVLLGVYAAACCLPAVRFFGDNSFVPGWVCLILGYIFLPWCANPLFVIGCGCLGFRRNAAAFLCGLGATVLAGLTPKLFGFDDLGAGFYVWVASTVLLTLFAGARAYLVRAHRLPPSPGDSDVT